MINMAMPAANLKTAGIKKPAINAASTAQAGYFFRGSAQIMNENIVRINGLDIAVAAAPTEGGQQ